MEERMDFSTYLKQLRGKPPASDAMIEAAEAGLSITLPADYSAFLRQADGAAGTLSGNYLVLWAVETLAKYNAGYQVQTWAPGLVLFGSDGGDTAYAFDARDAHMVVVAVPFIGMSLKAARLVAPTFAGFLAALAQGAAPL
jgi:hypothetical protein